MGTRHMEGRWAEYKIKRIKSVLSYIQMKEMGKRSIRRFLCVLILNPGEENGINVV